MTSFDYIVIGSGTAGAVLAARLSTNPHHQVLLVEAGRKERPSGLSTWYTWPTFVGTDVDWGHWTTPQSGLGGASLLLSQGKVLGGSSSTNGTMHVRARAWEYDRWNDFAEGWDYESLLPYFKRSESAPGRDPELRGTEGPVHAAPLGYRTELGEALFQAALDAGYPPSDDLNGSAQDGVAWNDHTVTAEGRQSVADAYLAAALQRPNLTLWSETTAANLLFEGRKCRGAVVTTGGQRKEVRAHREVIVAAGAIGSPHLLMLSGIGPAQHLQERGIDVLADSVGVGSNLHDHLLSSVVYECPEDMVERATSLPQTFIVRPEAASEAATNADLLFTGVNIPNHSPALTGPRSGYTVAFGLMHPFSRGSVRLHHETPASSPVVDPGYLTDPADTTRMLEGLRLARQIGSQAALKEWRQAEVLPGEQIQTREQAVEYLHRSAMPFFHPAGTCRLGDDETAVVDGQLRVRGVSGLRVVDASVIPEPLCANTNATVLAIAERAADMITSA